MRQVVAASSIFLLVGCVGLPVSNSPVAMQMEIRADLCGLAPLDLPAIGQGWGSVETEGRVPLSAGRLYGSGAVWDGSTAWIFGGYDHGQGGDEYVRGDPSGQPKSSVLAYKPGAAMAMVTDAQLPAPNWDMASAWTGEVAYLFGGQRDNQDRVFRFDPSSMSVEVLPLRLPAGGAFMSAIWDGRHVYLFGGGERSDRIMRFDPLTEQVKLLEARLPGWRQGAMAAWDGQSAYIFGGKDMASRLFVADIVRFDPNEEVVIVLPARLPTPLAYGAATWDGHQIVLMGGAVADPKEYEVLVRSSAIMTYEPLSLSVRSYPMWLPKPATSIAVISDGDGLLVFSPWQGDGPSEIWRVRLPRGLPFETELANTVWLDEKAYTFGGEVDPTGIRRYDPQDGEVETLRTKLPQGRTDSIAVAGKDHAYIVGGKQGGRLLDEVLRYDMRSGVIENLPIRLPEAVACGAGLLQDDRLILLGGVVGEDPKPTDAIVAIDLSEATASTVGRLPQPESGALVGHDGKDVVLLRDGHILRVPLPKAA